MKKKKNFKFMIFICIVLFSSCIGSSVYVEKLPAGYELKANDDMLGMSIYTNDEQYQIGVINATVFAVGFNNDFIIAKQHPFISFDSINKSITNYFIIPIKNKISKSPEKNKIGPLMLEEFIIKREELEIPDELDFSKVFEKLE